MDLNDSNKLKSKFYRAFAILLMCLFIPSLSAAVLGARAAFASAAGLATTEFKSEIITGTVTVFLPAVSRNWPILPPSAPNLKAIQNPDGDSWYDVSWDALPNVDFYTLEMASNSDFVSPSIAYEGQSNILIGPGRVSPGTYYYRVQAKNGGGASPWSQTQSITIYPLHTGMDLRWDGTGTISLNGYTDIAGSHHTRQIAGTDDVDVVQIHNHIWYDPAPYDFGEEFYTDYYTLSSGNFKSSTAEPDETFSWGYSWKLAYGSSFTNGATVDIDDQPFTVTGPTWGNTGIGYIQYWEFTNQNQIVLVEDIEGYKQVIPPGKAILRYEAGPYGMLIFDDIYRKMYYYGNDYDEYVHYIASLTYRNVNQVTGTTGNFVQSSPDPDIQWDKFLRYSVLSR